MKVRLVTIPEEQEVLAMWKEKSIDLLGEEYIEPLENYEEAVAEMIGHANVYVLEKNHELIGFASIVGGYYISNFFVNSEEEADLLMETLQKRYDELQADFYIEVNVNAWMEKWGFSKIGESQHDVLGYPEYQYEWLDEA